MQDNQEENPGTSDDQTETLHDVSVSIHCKLLHVFYYLLHCIVVHL